MVQNKLPTYRLPRSIRKHLLTLAVESDILLFGGIHGTQEIPRLVTGLLHSLAGIGYHALGLDLDHRERKAIEAWAVDNATQPFLRSSSDGRTSVEILLLARQALRSPRAWQLICFAEGEDNERSSWSAHTAAMADLLLREWLTISSTRLVGISGQLHTRLSPQTPDDPFWPSLAWYLGQHPSRPRICTVEICFQSNLRPPLVEDATSSSVPQLYPSAHHSITLVLPNATPATVPTMPED